MLLLNQNINFFDFDNIKELNGSTGSYFDEDGTITVDTGGLRTDESEALTMGDEVSVTGTIYKDPAMQFVDRYVKNKTGCFVNLLDFDKSVICFLLGKPNFLDSELYLSSIDVLN